MDDARSPSIWDRVCGPKAGGGSPETILRQVPEPRVGAGEFVTAARAIVVDNWSREPVGVVLGANLKLIQLKDG